MFYKLIPSETEMRKKKELSLISLSSEVQTYVCPDLVLGEVLIVRRCVYWHF